MASIFHKLSTKNYNFNEIFLKLIKKWYTTKNIKFIGAFYGLYN